MGVRGQWEIADGPESGQLLWLAARRRTQIAIQSNEYIPQLIKAGLQSFPTATLAAQLPALTAQVFTNNRFSTTESASDAAVMAAVRQGIQHVIFIIKENRTYDQVLGDLEIGNGDPALVQWGQTITPNLHKLAQTFVTLDNFLATSEVSNVVALTGTDKNDKVVGLIPTGWYPNSVSFSHDGKWAYVVNGKSPTGPNPNWCYSYGPPLYPSCQTMNEYNPQLTKAGLQSFPTATLAAQLPALTAQVLTNNRFSTTESASDAAVMAAVRQGIQHVIFIIKENRTYDQVLGDLPVGNGDPGLVQWGSAITPNQHNLAQTFVTLDNFMATAEVSNDGWPWTTSARAPDVVEHQYPVAYAGRGLSLDTEGLNRNVNVAIPTVAQRMAADPLTPNDPDVLAGQTDVAAPDGPNDEVNTGYLWDSALRAGLTVRNYGFFIDATCYNVPSCAIPLAHDPAATGTDRGHLPRMSPLPRSPIRTSAVSTITFRIITVTRSGSGSSMPITPKVDSLR